MPRFFSKKRVESRGNASGRAPLKRGTPLCLLKRRRGSKGEPSPGVPPFSLRLCVCADTLGGCRCPVLPFDPISLVLAQRNGVEPPKKSAFLPRRLHHSRERYCLGCLYSSSPDFGRGLVVVGAWVRVRRYAGRGALACPAVRPHFFGACPKKRCRAAKEKRFFTLVAPPFA